MCLDFSIPYYMNTAKHRDFFPAYSRHIRGGVRWLFFHGASLLLVKMGKHLEFTCGQTFLVSCFSDSLSSDSLNLVEFRPAKLLKNSPTDL